MLLMSLNGSSETPQTRRVFDMSYNDFLDMMPDKVTHYPFTGRDGYGKPSYSSGTEYYARVVEKNTLVRGFDGSEVVAKGMIWLGGLPSIAPEDRITLESGDNITILSIEKYPDENGLHHIKVFYA